MQVQIIDERLKADQFKPSTPGSAGVDLRACTQDIITLNPGIQTMIGTGIKLAIPYGWVGMIFPRSGLGAKGLILGNTVGIIDSDYRGEIKLIINNESLDCKTINIQPLDRIAQLVIIPHYPHNAVSINHKPLPGTIRGKNGFGSTGKQ